MMLCTSHVNGKILGYLISYFTRKQQRIQTDNTCFNIISSHDINNDNYYAHDCLCTHIMIPTKLANSLV